MRDASIRKRTLLKANDITTNVWQTAPVEVLLSADWAKPEAWGPSFCLAGID